MQPSAGMTLRKVPELVARVRALPAKTAVLDGEVIALGAMGRPEPFQVTMRRFGRRLDVERLRAELPLTTFLFDILHLDVKYYGALRNFYQGVKSGDEEQIVVQPGA